MLLFTIVINTSFIPSNLSVWILYFYFYFLIEHCLSNGCTFYEWANFLHNCFISITCLFLITSENIYFSSGELICVKFKFAQLFLPSRFMTSLIVLRDYFLNHFHSTDPFSSMFHLTCAFSFSRSTHNIFSFIKFLFVFFRRWRFPEVITSMQKSCFTIGHRFWRSSSDAGCCLSQKRFSNIKVKAKQWSNCFPRSIYCSGFIPLTLHNFFL